MTEQVHCDQDGSPEFTVFYADPVDEDGNVIGRAELKITASNPPAKAVKIPASEMAIPDDAPVFRVGGDDD